MPDPRLSHAPSPPIPVAVLGATGTVGRRLVQRVAEHPWFELVEVAASPASAGRTLAEAWTDLEALPGDGALGALRLLSTDDDLAATLVLSALPRGVAQTVEPSLAARGKLVVSNASAGRMQAGIPLVIPEVNPQHLDLLRQGRGSGSGGIITNPNCAVVPLTLALAPLHEAFGVEAVVATSFQAISGAGLPGPGAIALLDNVLPWIAGEEEKIGSEPQKILGRVEGSDVIPAGFRVSATSTRVPVVHGHLVDVAVRLGQGVSAERALDAMREWRGHAAELGLPSLPATPLRILDRPDRPQPRLDRDAEGGMAVTVGRIRDCPVHGLRFMALAHNLERGAAGAAMANAELAVRTGLLDPGPS